MFVSRTVAAEVLMEAESNRAGYAALKTLDREGGLRFPLAYVSSSLLCDFIERKCQFPGGRPCQGRVVRNYLSGHHSEALQSSRLSGITRSRPHQ
jgi:hypothetical protein